MAERSVILVIPANKRADGNKVYDAMGRGPNTFVVPASPSGNDPATHYFAHDGTMSEALAITSGRMPDDSGTVPDISGNTSPADTWLHWFPGEANESAALAKAKAACAAMQISVGSNIEGGAHRDGVVSGLSLQEIELEI